MAYRFKAKESVPDGIRRIVREEVDSATKELTTATGAKRDEAIHEARKSIKKVRGALRLMQPELGRAYSEENRRLGDTGRELSEIRDAEAIIEVFDGLVMKYRAQIKPEAIRAVRRGLLRNKRETQERLKVDTIIHHAVSTLKATSKAVDRMPLNEGGFQAIAPGYSKRYKRGRQAMAIARKDPRPENFHEWRKRVKDHWYHVRLLESLWTDVLLAREGELKNLETWLGDDHNLFVLQEKLQADADRYGGDRNVKVFGNLMADYSKQLREQSLSLGERLYEQKPKALVRDMSKLWDAWQNQPASMKNEQKEQRAQKKGPAHQTKGKRAAA